MSTERNISCAFALSLPINVKLLNTLQENTEYFDIHRKISLYRGNRTTTEIPLADGFKIKNSQKVDTRHYSRSCPTISSASARISRRTHSDLEQLFRPERVHRREHIPFIINISHGER
jgi:hypothetical protein